MHGFGGATYYINEIITNPTLPVVNDLLNLKVVGYLEKDNEDSKNFGIINWKIIEGHLIDVYPDEEYPFQIYSNNMNFKCKMIASIIFPHAKGESMIDWISDNIPNEFPYEGVTWGDLASALNSRSDSFKKRLINKN